MKTSIFLSLCLAPLLAFADVLHEGVIREDAPDEETTIEPYGNANERRLDSHYDYGYRNRNGPLPDIEYWVLNRGSFNTLSVLLANAGLAPGGPLNQANTDYTLFAPSNMAFRNTFRAYPGLRRFLLSPAGADALLQVLTYHALVGSVFEQDIPLRGVTVSTLQGDELTVFKECSMGDSQRECTVYLLDGTDDVTLVTHADQDTSNGVVHAIDKVLIPPALINAVEAFRRG